MYLTCFLTDAAWNLLGVTRWVVEFLEQLFKECIFNGERADPGPSTPKEGGSAAPGGAALDSPIFLHLAHPHALTRVQAAAEHVRRFRDQVARLAPRGDSSHIAHDVLMDVTDGSGIDLTLLGPLLSDIFQDCKKLDGVYPPSSPLKWVSYLATMNSARAPAQLSGVQPHTGTEGPRTQSSRSHRHVQSGGSGAALHQTRGPLGRARADGACWRRRPWPERREHRRGAQGRAVAPPGLGRVRALRRALGRCRGAQERLRACAEPVAGMGEGVANALRVWGAVGLWGGWGLTSIRDEERGASH